MSLNFKKEITADNTHTKPIIFDNVINPLNRLFPDLMGFTSQSFKGFSTVVDSG
jgi:hypothetical protein